MRSWLFLLGLMVLGSVFMGAVLSYWMVPKAAEPQSELRIETAARGGSDYYLVRCGNATTELLNSCSAREAWT